jgi:hypothetical protein
LVGSSDGTMQLNYTTVAHCAPASTSNTYGGIYVGPNPAPLFINMNFTKCHSDHVASAIAVEPGPSIFWCRYILQRQVQVYDRSS